MILRCRTYPLTRNLRRRWRKDWARGSVWRIIRSRLLPEYGRRALGISGYKVRRQRRSGADRRPIVGFGTGRCSISKRDYTSWTLVRILRFSVSTWGVGRGWRGNGLCKFPLVIFFALDSSPYHQVQQDAEPNPALLRKYWCLTW